MSGRAIILSIFLCIIYCVTSSSQDDYDYGFVIDAGSTGSRIYAYEWSKRTSTSTTPPESHPVEIGSKKEGPVSDINSLSDAQSLLTPLINFVKDLTIAHEARFSEFPIYLKATAGMRLLGNQRRIDILNWIREVFNDDTINPFLFKNSYSIIASGSEEATFDWISANYISNTLSNDVTVGALDLGGASTQIAFAPIPSSDIIDSYTFVDPFNHPFRLYTVSHLGYGTNEIARLIAAKVYKTNSNENPCLLDGTTENYEFIRFNGTKVYNVNQIGVAGNMGLCESYIRDVLYLNEHECLFDDGEECSINGVYIPHIPSNMQWIAFSAFAYTILADEHGISNTATLAEIYDFTMNTLCEYTFDELNTALPGLYAPKTLCLLNLYIVVLLRDAYHFDINARNILWTNDLNGGTVGWQWGSILYDANLLDYTYTGCQNPSTSAKSNKGKTDNGARDTAEVEVTALATFKAEECGVDGAVSIDENGNVFIDLEFIDADVLSISGCSDTSSVTYYIYNKYELKGGDLKSTDGGECTYDVIGNVFDPFDTQLSCNDYNGFGDKYFECSIGDLSGRFGQVWVGKISASGNISEQPNDKESGFCATRLTPEALYGRSMVFKCNDHDENENILFCAPFVISKELI